jgi:hypothetical protein
MRSLIVLVAAAALAGAAVALAQTSQPIAPPSNSGYYGWSGYHHASTAAEGAARGMADVVRSQGEANLSNSAAAINYGIARSNQIQNRSAWTSTYFQMREENRRARAAERRPRATMADLVRYAQAGKPKPLSPSELDLISGAVQWPMWLQIGDYAHGRAELEKVFASRASIGTISPADYMKVREVTTAMLGQLKGQIRDVPPAQYTAAKRFIESLAYEAARPLG